MDDQAAWEQAVAAARSSYATLSPATAAELDGLIEKIVQLKQKLVETVTAAGSSEICRNCGGECCRFGKFHVTVLDILAYLKNGVQVVIPDFSSNPACPYSNASGCSMSAGYRPMTCVVFNCQQVEEQLSSALQELLYICEQELRESITKGCHITGQRLDRALLLSGN